MKSILRCVALAAVLAVPLLCSARGVQPDVQNITFQTIVDDATASPPAPQAAALLAALNNASSTGRPLVIEFYSRNSAACTANGVDECQEQVPVTQAVVQKYQSQIDFISVAVEDVPGILATPDVHALTHIFVTSYTDPQTYVATKVWGFINEHGMDQCIGQAFKNLGQNSAP
jgi:thiol-disulfide isomerase/thioredoxin